MSAFLIHLKKELRDQCAVLIGVFAALPVLLVLAMWAFADRLVDATLDTAAPVILGVALVLFLLAIAGDTFASEVRRGTIALLRRTPRAMRWSFLAKITFVLVGSLAVLLWQALLLHVAWALWGRMLLPDVFSIFVQSFALTVPIMGVGLWMLLASTWLRHGGMAVLLAPLLIALLAVPAVLWAKENAGLYRWLLRDSEDAFPWLLGAACLIPVLAAAWSYLGGRRVVRSAWSATWRGLVALALLSSAVYAYGTVRVDRLFSPQPGDPGLQVTRAHVGTGSRFLFVDVCRFDESNFKLLTPTQTWRIDLARGTWGRLGPWSSQVFRPLPAGLSGYPRSPRASLDPAKYLVQYRPTLDDDMLAVWIDGQTGEVLKTLPRDVFTDDVLPWLDEVGRNATWVRDGEDRRVWLRYRDALLRRDGDKTLPVLDWRTRPYGRVRASTWGWVAYTNRGALRLVTVDAATNEVRELAGHDHPGRTWFLSATDVLIPHGRSDWLVENLDTREQSPARGVPENVFVASNWHESPLICSGGPKNEGRLLLWDPVGGTSRTVTLEGEPSEEIVHPWIVGRSASGTVVLGACRQELWTLLRLDVESATATRLTDCTRFMPWVVAVEPGGAIVAIEPGVTVVRLGPKPGMREVLFPR